LQALFIIASVLTVTSAIASKTNTMGFFIGTSLPAETPSAEFSWFQNEPPVNALDAASR